MLRSFLICVFTSTSVFVATPLAAQTAGPYTVWQTYMSSGVNAASRKKWQEAEAYFAAAVEEAKECKPPERLTMISKYAFATAQYEEGNVDLARTTLSGLDKNVEAADVQPEYQGLVPMLTMIGETFYYEAKADTDAAIQKKLQGNDLQKVQDDALLKNQFARRYFEWAMLISRRFLAPASPELQTLAADYGLASYAAANYDTAILAFSQLSSIVLNGALRNEQLSRGSAEYSLAAKSDSTQTTKAFDFNPAAISVFIGRSYYERAAQLNADKKSEDAMQTLEKAVHALTPYLTDADYGKSVRTMLSYVYDDEAELLKEKKAHGRSYKTSGSSKRTSCKKYVTFAVTLWCG